MTSPLSLLGGGVTGGVAPSSSASAGSASGDAGGTAGTGDKVFNFGSGNPNTVGGVLSNPLVLVALVAAVFLITR